MIHVPRGPRPEASKANAEVWKAALLVAKTPEEKNAAINKYKTKNVKQALVSMFCGKCGYCESKVTHVDYGHIEHYRPKSGPAGRPDLAFAWSNLLLACGICNGTGFKGDRFPGPDEDGPIIHPCKDEPVLHFTFHYDPVTRLASVYGITDRGRTTVALLGLNRADLRAYRSSQVRKLVAMAVDAQSDPEAAALIQDWKKASGEYAAFARTLA